MKSPFPGMDPYLEHPSLWPDIHNSLIAAIRDELAPRLAPRYYVGLERRTYLMNLDDVVFIGRPDIAVGSVQSHVIREAAPALAYGGIMTVEVPMKEEVGENFLEVREVKSGRLVTVLELLSPANKLHSEGRKMYEEKREMIFRSRTNLVEIDLLRAGEPLPLRRKPAATDYRILVSHATERPRAQLIAFNLPTPIPTFVLPLLPGDEEPDVDLNGILHALYTRARFDLRLDYEQLPVPPLSAENTTWAQSLIQPPIT
jgi:hypothetical protein